MALMRRGDRLQREQITLVPESMHFVSVNQNDLLPIRGYRRWIEVESKKSLNVIREAGARLYLNRAINHAEIEFNRAPCSVAHSRMRTYSERDFLMPTSVSP